MKILYKKTKERIPGTVEKMVDGERYCYKNFNSDDDTKGFKPLGELLNGANPVPKVSPDPIVPSNDSNVVPIKKADKVDKPKKKRKKRRTKAQIHADDKYKEADKFLQKADKAYTQKPTDRTKEAYDDAIVDFEKAIELQNEAYA